MHIFTYLPVHGDFAPSTYRSHAIQYEMLFQRVSLIYRTEPTTKKWKKDKLKSKNGYAQKYR